jgi:3-oxoacyl-[acyl-carrier protein] reductase
MELGLNGKTALITGAGRGLGSAICQSLAREGVRIIACSRTESDLESLMNKLNNPEIHQFVSVDLAEKSGPKSLIEFVESAGLNIDILVNNVGGTLGVKNPFQQIEDFRSVMHLNLEIAVELNAFFIPRMQRRKWGRVCHISSLAGQENQGPPAYCCAKSALNAYIRSVGRLVAQDNVIVNGVMPGAILTKNGSWENALINNPEEVKRFLSDTMSIKRFGTEFEISEIVSFMVSEKASFLVGSILLADGGQGVAFQN